MALSTHTRSCYTESIDHITISRQWRTSLMEVRSQRVAACASDHHLLIGLVKINIAKTETNFNLARRRRFNLDKFKEPRRISTHSLKYGQWHDEQLLIKLAPTAVKRLEVKQKLPKKSNLRTRYMTNHRTLQSKLTLLS